MASIRSRLFIFILRNRHFLRFRLKKEAVDWNTSIPRLRREAEKAVKFFGKLPDGIEVSPISIDYLHAEWISHPSIKKDKVMLYFHGGGYVLGSSKAHIPIVAKFVKGSGISALLFDYRLAPEHPFPDALNDSIKVYDWLLSQKISPANIVFVGDSAGGGLCLATLLSLRDQRIPLPAAAVTLSPWTDVKCTGESHKTKAKVCLSPEGAATVFSKYYAGDNDPCLPLISPLYGDLHGLPPILIYTGEDETLLDDSTRFAEKARSAGVDITLNIAEGMFHCYPVCAPIFPEATQAMNKICYFIKTRIGK